MPDLDSIVTEFRAGRRQPIRAVWRQLRRSITQYYKFYLQLVVGNSTNVDYIKVFDNVQLYLGTVLASSSKDMKELQFALSMLETLARRYPDNASIVKQRDRVRMIVNLKR